MHQSSHFRIFLLLLLLYLLLNMIFMHAWNDTFPGKWYCVKLFVAHRCKMSCIKLYNIAWSRFYIVKQYSRVWNISINRWTYLNYQAFLFHDLFRLIISQILKIMICRKFLQNSIEHFQNTLHGRVNCYVLFCFLKHLWYLTYIDTIGGSITV